MSETNQLFEELAIAVKGQAERPRMSVVVDRQGELRIACSPGGGSLALRADANGVRGSLGWTHPEDDDAPQSIRIERDGSKLRTWWNGTSTDSPTVQAVASNLLETLRVQSDKAE